jgi:hypothetical protein
MIEFICINIALCVILAAVHLGIKRKCKHEWTDWYEKGPMYGRHSARVCLKCGISEEKDSW